MSFADITEDLKKKVPGLRGSLSANQPLAPYVWFRAGGVAQVLFSPADEADLVQFLKNCPTEIPVTVLGIGSNVIIRDGGIAGVVVRLGAKGFGAIQIEPDYRLRVGTATPDMKLARAAADASIAGLEFYRGIPGSIGGALRMNAGAHGHETKDVLIEARGILRDGSIKLFSLGDMGLGYRQCSLPETVIFTSALFQGRAGKGEEIEAEMARITQTREAAQPIREKTGGSTFKNPPDGKAWQLIDAAGCRGLEMGDAHVSQMHCNFLINNGTASAHDIEALGEEVRRRVKAHSGVQLEWEIKRLGRPA